MRLCRTEMCRNKTINVEVNLANINKIAVGFNVAHAKSPDPYAESQLKALFLRSVASRFLGLLKWEGDSASLS